MIKKVKISNYIENGVVNDLTEDKITDKYFKDIEIDASILNYTEFNGCIFENVVFKNKISNLYFIHCKFLSCDLSNVKLIKTRFYIVEIENSKMLGISFDECSLEETLINESNLKMSCYVNTRHKNTLFQECSLEESFFENIKQNNLYFKKCNCKNIDIVNFKLNNIDVSTCDIEGIKVNEKDVKGLIIDEYQAVELIKLIEVVVRK